MLFNLLATEGEGGGGSFVFLIAILAIAVLMFVWSGISNKKKQKANQDRLSALKVGDRVKTIGGICGFVAEIRDSDNTFVLETGLDDNKNYIRFDKQAIYQTAPNGGATLEQKTEEVKTEEVKTEEVPAVEEVKADNADKTE